MDTAEVEIRHLQGNRQLVIAECFAVSERFPGESPVEHANAQVATL